MLNLGLIEPDAAKRFLMEELVLSERTAQEEVNRYTFEIPGQAGRFEQRRFHDFILSQGPLPFELLDKVVVEELLR